MKVLPERPHRARATSAVLALITHHGAPIPTRTDRHKLVDSMVRAADRENDRVAAMATQIRTHLGLPALPALNLAQDIEDTLCDDYGWLPVGWRAARSDA